MLGKWFEKLHPYLEWLALICGITGITIFAICGKLKSGIMYLVNKISENPELTKIVCCIAAMVGLAVCVIILTIIYCHQTKKLKKRISACKKALKTIDKRKLTGVTPVDFYLIDKDTYDEFKTKLKITECLLEVIFIKNTEKPDEYDFKFKWSLRIKNSSFKAQNMAKFIYSGAKDGEEEPHLWISSDHLTTETPEERNDIKVLGDDRFVEIGFTENFKRGDNATLYITYVFKNYKIDRENIPSIWLVPDALGFADMDKFFIYFYSDGEIVDNKTEVRLRSYRLDTEYEPKSKKTLEYREFINHEFENVKAGFNVKSSRRDKLHGYGYQLKLTNHIN